MTVRLRDLTFSLCALLVPFARSKADEPPPKIKDTQPETQKLLTPEEARAAITLPDGFRVSLFASEPQVRQPIALATDARGRLWVAENNTYAESSLNYDLTQHDRIHILTDADHDGRAETHKVFWDKGQKLTSVETGFGGVWALCPPRLFFIPDRNGDDAPDGEPEVVLDGFEDSALRHNIANGLRWGPDGWLYGRHGIQATSYVGAPGTPKAQRAAFNCAIWRYHPTRKLFEVVCRGGTNSWGSDWDARGELFYINTVIGHLWHAVPGAYTQRMYGEHDNPHLYTLLGQIGDHFHWDTVERWDDIRKLGVTPTTDQAGGGHAHTGLMIYQGDNWPERYRGQLFTFNFHGRRVNTDTLHREGAGFVGRHAPDFLKSADPWFRPIDLITGSDGGVYMADWSDIGECHDNDGVHRSSGRIFKVVYGDPSAPSFADISKLSDVELIALQRHPNDWYSRVSRRLLQERAAEGKPMDKVYAALKTEFASPSTPEQKLRALWSLYVTSGTTDAWLIDQLKHDNENVRSWAVRLLGDGKTPTPEAIAAMNELAKSERSGLVKLYLASALRQFPPTERWPLASRLSADETLGKDPMFPLMIWYAIEDAVPDRPDAAVSLVGSSRSPIVIRHVSRRLTENLERVPAPVDALVASLSKTDDAYSRERALAVLSGMSDALRGWRQAKGPASWVSARKAIEAKGKEGLSQADDETLRRLLREISVVFGDGRATDDLLKIATAKSDDVAAKRDALRVLVEAREPRVVPVLRNLISDRDLGSDAARGLSAFDEPEIPGFLVSKYRDMKPTARTEAIVALSSRPTWAKSMLDAIASGTIDRNDIPAFQIRQMGAFSSEEIQRRLKEFWPARREVSAAKREQIDRLKGKLTASTLATADLSNGRRLFATSCATCHVLFGQGGRIGPELTGAQRQNLEYVLENVVDPSATVTNDYRMTSVALNDGRVLNGVVGNRTGAVVTVQTPTERLTIKRSDIDGFKDSNLSLMPDGLLDPLADKDLRDLVGYLMSPQQVPLPAGVTVEPLKTSASAGAP